MKIIFRTFLCEFYWVIHEEVHLGLFLKLILEMVIAVETRNFIIVLKNPGGS